MKKQTSSPYRNFEFGKTSAPDKTKKGAVKSGVIRSDADLRAGGKK